MDRVPRDVLIIILKLLDSESCGRCRRVCRFWKETIDRGPFPLVERHVIHVKKFEDADRYLKPHWRIVADCNNSNDESDELFHFTVYERFRIDISNMKDIFGLKQKSIFRFVDVVFGRKSGYGQRSLYRNLYTGEIIYVLSESSLVIESDCKVYEKGIRRLRDVQLAFPGLIGWWKFISKPWISFSQITWIMICFEITGNNDVPKRRKRVKMDGKANEQLLRNLLLQN